MPFDGIPGQKVEGHKPVPRIIVSPETWRMLTDELAGGRMTLFGLWGDADRVHMALLQDSERIKRRISGVRGRLAGGTPAAPRL